MLTISEAKKRGWLEEFNNVMALYQVFNEGRNTLRTKRAEYRCDEVQALPIDFIIDVELKAKKVLPGYLYALFLRLAHASDTVLIPESTKLMLGRVWEEYGLGIDGSYKSLYFKTKNEQMRSFLKEASNVRNTAGDPFYYGSSGNGEPGANLTA